MKLGIRSKLFLVSVAVILASVVAADTYLTQSLDADLTRRVEDDLFIRADLVQRELSRTSAAPDDLIRWDEAADGLAAPARARVTIVRDDGVVLGDSEVATEAIGSIEGHALREEVLEATRHGRGSTTRMSATLNQRMLYVATPFRTDHGVSGVARVAVPLTQVDAAIGRLRRTVFIGSGVALLLAVIMTTLAAHLMSRTVRAFTDVAKRLSAGDLDARTRPAGDDEVAELGKALDQLASSLSGALGELRGERDLLGRVLDGMREGVLLVDKDGRVALTNPALREMLLLDANVSGRRPLELVRSADLKELLDRVANSGETGSSEIDLGELKPRRLLVHATPLADLGGTLAVFVDVTDMRRLENMRRDFVANVSHELRTPIATVLSAAETLRGTGLSSESAEEFLDIIDRNAGRLHRLVEDLLDLSKVEAREFKLALEPLEIESVVDQIVPLYRERVENKRVRISKELDADTLAIADRKALEQILSNLVDNALKYTSVESTVTIRSVRRDGMLDISVADTGPGIEDKHLPRLYERFYRADAGRSRELGGTGLGLSIVKNLTEAMGGSVAVTSQLGRGSTFTISLPRA